MMNAIEKEERMPGSKAGKLTSQKARSGAAPSTAACSSYRLPKARVTSVRMVME